MAGGRSRSWGRALESDLSLGSGGEDEQTEQAGGAKGSNLLGRGGGAGGELSPTR